jgi:hypothetical protein
MNTRKTFHLAVLAPKQAAVEDFSNQRRRLMAAAVGSMLLSACGGGKSDNSSSSTANAAQPPLAGTVETNADGSLLGNITYQNQPIYVLVTRDDTGTPEVNAQSMDSAGTKFYVITDRSAANPIIPAYVVNAATGAFIKFTQVTNSVVVRFYDASGNYIAGYAINTVGTRYVVGTLPSENADPATITQPIDITDQVQSDLNTLLSEAGLSGAQTTSLLDRLSPVSTAYAQSPAQNGGGGWVTTLTGVVIVAAGVLALPRSVWVGVPLIAAGVATALNGMGLLAAAWVGGLINTIKGLGSSTADPMNAFPAFVSGGIPLSLKWAATSVGTGSCDDSVFNTPYSGVAQQTSPGYFTVTVNGRTVAAQVPGTNTFKQTYPEGTGTTTETVTCQVLADGTLTGTGQYSFAATDYTCSGSYKITGTWLLQLAIPTQAGPRPLSLSGASALA